MSNVLLRQTSSSLVRLGVSLWDQMRPQCMNAIGVKCDPGLELELFSMLATVLNFTLEIKYASEVGCGVLKEDGNYTGLIGMLQRDEVDVIGNLCLLLSDRIDVPWLKFSWPVLQFKQSFLIKAPEPYYFFRIDGPFERPVWISVFVVNILFLFTFSLVYYFLDHQSYLTAVKQAATDFLNIFTGLDCRLVQNAWFLFICFTGFTVVAYSTFITVAILRPISIERPFTNNVELADALESGQFRILDYYKPAANVQCLDNHTCTRINKAKENSYYFQLPKTADATQFTQLMIQEILNKDNLVFVKGRYYLRVYLNAFAGRQRFWLIEDEWSREEWSGYFYRDTFKMGDMIKPLLILMGDAKDNLKAMYTSLSYMSITKKRIKGSIPEKIVFDLKLLYGPLVSYGIGICVTLVAFAFEHIHHSTVKRRKEIERTTKKDNGSKQISTLHNA